MWNGSGGFDGSREFDRSHGSGGSRGSRRSRGSNSSRRSDEYIGSEGSHAYDESGISGGTYMNDESGGSGGPYMNDESGGSQGPYMNDGSGGSGGPYMNDGSGGSGGPYMNDGSGGSGGPYMNDGSGGSGGPYMNDGSGGSQGPYMNDGSGGSEGPYMNDGSGGSGGPYVNVGFGGFGIPVYDGSSGSGGSLGSKSWPRAPAMKSAASPPAGPRGLRRSSLLFNVQRPIENVCECYYAALAGLFCQTVGEIERITKVNPSVLKTLPLVAEFYKQYGYSGDYGYKVYKTREELKDYLRQVFTDERQRTARHQRKLLRMKLIVGYFYSLKRDGHAVALKAWTEDGELNYCAVDYTYDVGRPQRLPQNYEAKSFFCFQPKFYFDSYCLTSVNLFGISQYV